MKLSRFPAGCPFKAAILPLHRMFLGDASRLASTWTGGAIALAAGALSGGSLLAYSVFVPRCQFWGPVIRRIPRRDAIALTFDDGPHPDFTPRILDSLAQHGARGSFFVIGSLARRHAGVIRRIHNEGHTLGNHSLDHDHFGVNRGRAYWRRQLSETQNIILDITGHPPTLFRPPMGFKTWNIVAAARELQLPVVGWSQRACDTRLTDARVLAARLIGSVSGGDILLLHDGLEPARMHSTQEHTVGALPALLGALKDRSLLPMPLSEVLSAKLYAD